MEATSVIIPIYITSPDLVEMNRRCIERWEQAIDKKQGDEVIVVDDCSPFEHGLDADVRLEKNSGVATAWNRGIEKARNNRILLSNSDIYVWEWEPMLRSLTRYDIVFPLVYNCDIHRVQKHLAGECFLFTKRLWNFVGKFDESYGMYFEDTDFFMRAQDKGARFNVCEQAFVVHQGSGTVNKVMGKELKFQKSEENRLKYEAKFNNRYPSL